MAYVTHKMVASKGKTKVKKWLAKWNVDGKEREKGFTTKKEARAHAADMQKKHEDKDLSEALADAMTTRLFRDVAADYIAKCEKPGLGLDPCEPITIRGYQSLLRLHILPHADPHGKLYMHRIKTRDFERLRDGMYKAEASYDRVSKAVNLFRMILRFAIKKEWREKAMPEFELSKPRSVLDAELERAEEVYSKDQLYTLIQAARSLATDKRKDIAKRWVLFEPMLHFLIETGCRIGEARGFSRQNLDREGGKVRIRANAREDGTLKSPKSIGGRRVIPVPSAELFVTLDGAERSHNHDLLFAASGGKPISLGNLYRGMYRPLIKRANMLAETGDDPRLNPVPAWGYHAIRHAYASRLIASGANLKQLSRWMGHSDPAFTMRVYGKLFEDGHEEVMAKMAI